MPARCRTSVRHRRPHARARPRTTVRARSEASVERGLGRVLETSPFPILLVSPRRHRPPLRLRPVDRRRRHLAHADGRPRGRRARAARTPSTSPSSARAARGPTSSGSPRSSSTPRTGSPGMRAVILLGIALRPARARARVRDRPDGRRVVALDLRRRPPRDPRRPVGLDAARADRGASALRRRSLAARRRVAARHPPADPARAPAPRRLGEPPRLGRPRRGPHGAPRGRRAGARTPARVDPARARRPRAARPSSRRRTGRSSSPTTT